MRLLIPIFISLVLISCNKKEELQGVNFVVKDKEDTLSYFYYKGHEKYFFYYEEIRNGLPSDKDILSKIPGEFVFGLRGRLDSMNRFFIFREVSGPNFKVTDKPQIPFMRDELRIDSCCNIIFYENYVDSLLDPIRKVEVQIAINNSTKDTIIFQELNYLIKGNDLFTSFITYDKIETREEMRVLLDEAVNTIKKSIQYKPYKENETK